MYQTQYEPIGGARVHCGGVVCTILVATACLSVYASYTFLWVDVTMMRAWLHGPRGCADNVTVVRSVLEVANMSMRFAMEEAANISTVRVRISAAANTSATSGVRFTGARRRTYDAGPGDAAAPSVLSASWLDTRPHLRRTCARWVVSTTIFPPTPAVRAWASLDGWCVMVVGDMKSVSPYDDVSGCLVYVGVDDQLELAEVSRTARMLPFNHFGRKNVGYLLAIMNGAEVIYDSDDDNELTSATVPVRAETDAATVPLVVDSGVFNPYPIFKPSPGTVWPRGMSLDAVQRAIPHKIDRIIDGTSTLCAVQQLLADGDPDVDAIYRLTRPLPVRFAATDGGACVAIPRGTLVPYNAQATVHHRSSFWGLLLPVSVHGRVADIWRGYFSQPILWSIGRRVSFCPPAVVQVRNAHDYLRDLESEIPLYLQVPALVEALLGMRLDEDVDDVTRLMEKLWIDMYERGFIEAEDVALLRGWVADLRSLGYAFPEREKTAAIPPAPACPAIAAANAGRPPLFPRILLVVNYNEPYYNTSCFLRELWGDLFGAVTFFGAHHDAGFGIVAANISSEICQLGVMNSCGRFFDASMAKAIDLYGGGGEYDGYLFVHDDVYFNIDRLVSMDVHKVWSTRDMAWFAYAPGTPPERWFVWSGLEESECSERLRWNMPRGTHDMYYIPAPLAKEYARLTRILRYHGVESEAAGPTAISCLVGDDYETWQGHYEYSNRLEIEKKYTPGLNFIHPLKYSNGKFKPIAAEWKRRNMEALSLNDAFHI